MLKHIFGNFLKGRSETTKVVSSVSKDTISGAYTRRSADIDSLRQYDRGEKTIHAPNLRDTLSRVR